MRVGVVGHVEIVTLAVVARLPAAGEIATAREAVTVAAGGAAIAAVVQRELAGAATLWTAVGDDDAGAAAVAELREVRGLDVRSATRRGPTRTAFAHLADDGERTITVAGARHAPAAGDDLDDLTGVDGVYVTAADAAALAAARAGARIVVATPRVGPELATAAEPVDVLVGSDHDPGEPLDTTGWNAPPRAVVRTAGAQGGSWTTHDGGAGRWGPTPLPGPPVDSFGCGDAFAGALTLALAQGRTLADACAEAARAGAHRLTLRGPYG